MSPLPNDPQKLQEMRNRAVATENLNDKTNGEYGESEDLKKTRMSYEHPIITRYLGNDDTLVISIMGIIAISLIVLIGISFWCSSETTKILMPAFTTVIGYLAGKKINSKS